MRNTILWILQIFLGVYFVAVGILHFIVPEGLPSVMEWMYDLSDTMHVISGTAEILGGLGLILPSITRIRPELTVWAAVGLMVVMAGAAVYHIGREEWQSLPGNLLTFAVLGFIAYGRWRLEPIGPREPATGA